MNDINKEQLAEFNKFVSKVNKRIIKNFGGTFGRVDDAKLDFDLWNTLRRARRKKENFYESWSIFILQAISQNHAFTDGNKRTAFVMCRFILLLGRKDFEVDYEQAESYLKKIAAKRVGYDKIVRWVRKHIVPSDKKVEESVENFINELKNIVSIEEQ
jgi:death on curing protein